MCDGARRSRQPTSRIRSGGTLKYPSHHAGRSTAPRPFIVDTAGAGRTGTSGSLRTGSGPRTPDRDEQTGQDEGTVTERAQPRRNPMQ